MTHTQKNLSFPLFDTLFIANQTSLYADMLIIRRTSYNSYGERRTTRMANAVQPVLQSPHNVYDGRRTPTPQAKTTNHYSLRSAPNKQHLLTINL